MKVVILGTGDSVNAYKPCNCVTIGVNDVFKFYPTNHLLCLDYPQAFTKERLETIRNSTPDLFVTCMPEWEKWFKDKIQIIKLATFRSEISQIEQDVYPYSIMSPFVAMVHAYKIGAKEIVIYGVDLLNHQHLSQDVKVTRILRDVKMLNDYFIKKGINMKVFNRSSALSDVLPAISESI